MTNILETFKSYTRKIYVSSVYGIGDLTYSNSSVHLIVRSTATYSYV
jgi:hypothetical protein